MTDLPEFALSVRQPWAWAIIHGGKPIENRSWHNYMKELKFRGRVAIHASKGMTRDEYDSASDFMISQLVACPEPHQLQRGGIIGSVDVVDIVTKSASPWFFGSKGLVLANPEPCEFIPSVGALGFFKWRPADPSVVPSPARWMIPEDDRPPMPKRQAKEPVVAAVPAMPLFGDGVEIISQTQQQIGPVGVTMTFGRIKPTVSS